MGNEEYLAEVIQEKELEIKQLKVYAEKAKAIEWWLCCKGFGLVEYDTKGGIYETFTLEEVIENYKKHFGDGITDATEYIQNGGEIYKL